MIRKVEIICAFCDAKGEAKADVPADVTQVKAVCPKCQKEGKHIKNKEGNEVPHTDGLADTDGEQLWRKLK